MYVMHLVFAMGDRLCDHGASARTLQQTVVVEWMLVDYSAFLYCLVTGAAGEL